MEVSQGQIIQKPKMQELSSFFITHRRYVMHEPVRFHKYISYDLGVMARTQFTILNKISLEEIIQNANMQGLSFLFMTRRPNVTHALVKFHEYIPYGSGVTAWTRFTIWN